MKKFKINKKLSKKFISITLGSIIALSSLVGCNAFKNNKMWFRGSNLKYVSVITFEDEQIDIVSCNLYCSPRVCNGEHDVYKSIVSGKMFTDDVCKAKSSADYWGTNLDKYSIKNTENILCYLTIEELEMANENKLTEEDISNIISRIFEEQKDIQKIKKAN